MSRFGFGFGPQRSGRGGRPPLPVVGPVLNALTVSPSSATVGTAYSGTINGLTSGSSIALSGDGAAGLSIAGGVITGTPTTAGAVNIVETLAGATGSPRTSSGVVTVVSNAYAIGFAGSSTPEKYFNTFTGPSNARVTKTSNGTTYTPVGTTAQGAATLGDALVTALNRDVQFISSGSGGTTLSEWEAAGSTLRAAFVNAINARGGIDAAVIGVGFNDARLDRSVTSVASHAAKLRSLYAKIRSETNLPNLPIFLLATQKYTEGNATSAAQTVMVRSAELLVAEDANNRLYAHVYDLAQIDGIHMANGEYTKHALRGAAQILARINGTAQVRGPKMLSAVAVSPTQTDVTIQYVSGSDFTPTSGLTGFRVSIDSFATTLAISAAARQSATVVRLTHASTGASAVTANVDYMATGAPVVTGTLYANTTPTTPPDPTITPLAFTTIADAGSGGGGGTVARTAKVNHNFNSSTNIATYNNFVIPAETAGNPSANDELSMALVDDAGAATPWTMRITEPFIGPSASTGSVGTSTGNNSGVAPDAVMLSYWFMGDSPVGNARRSPAALTLTGLNPARLYTLSFVGSRGAATSRSTTYTAVGVNTKTGAHTNNQNTTLSTVLTDMQPTAGGVLVVSIEPTAAGQYGYVNETKIMEQAT